MAALVIPQTVQVILSGTTIGRPWTNVYAVRAGADGEGGGAFMDQAAAEELVDAFLDSFNLYKTTFNPQWRITQAIVADIQTATSPSYEVAVTPVIGTGTGEPLPPHLSACVTHRTAYRGRSYRGRTYLAGFGEPANDTNGQIISTVRTALDNLFTTLGTNLAAIDAGLWRLAVASRVLGESFSVVSSSCNADWDHQDRRKN